MLLEELAVEDVVRRCIQNNRYPSLRRLRAELEMPGCLRRTGVGELRTKVLDEIYAESSKKTRKESVAAGFGIQLILWMSFAWNQ